MPPVDSRTLHERLFKIDTHIDTPTARLMKPGWDFAARHERATERSQCDLPRMAGSVDALVFAVYVTQVARTPAGHRHAHDYAVQCLERTHEVVRQNAAHCALALTAAAGPRLKAEGRRAIYLSIENAYSLGRDVANVAQFHRLGVRLLGLTHMLNNDLADSSTDPRGAEWGGLSPLGREVVAECNRLGIVLDASHASDDVLRELLERSRSPVVLSHSSCRALCDHPRNVGDELLRALAAQGGVIHMNALPVGLVAQARGAQATAAISAMLMQLKDAELTPEVKQWAGAEWDRIDREFPGPAATLDDYVRHLEHAVEVAGIDHVGIGCDFDGGGGVAGMDDVSEYPNLTAALVARGWKEADLAKVWGGNTLRVLRAAELAAIAR